LTLEEWSDLGSLEEVMKERSDKRLRDMIVKGICGAFGSER